MYDYIKIMVKKYIQQITNTIKAYATFFWNHNKDIISEIQVWS